MALPYPTSGQPQVCNPVSYEVPVQFVEDPSNDAGSEHLKNGRLATFGEAMQRVLSGR